MEIKRDLANSQLDLAKEKEKSNKFQEMYQNLLQEKERNEFTKMCEVNQLKNQLHYLNVENEQLSSINKAQSINNEHMLCNICYLIQNRYQ